MRGRFLSPDGVGQEFPTQASRRSDELTPNYDNKIHLKRVTDADPLKVDFLSS